MWSRSQDNKWTCTYLSAGSILLGSAHIMTQNFALSFIIHVYVTGKPLVALRNRIIFGVPLLTVCMWHFPLSYEGVEKPVIEAMCHAQRMCQRMFNFIFGRSDKFQILFSSWLDFPLTIPHISTMKIDMGNLIFAPYAYWLYNSFCEFWYDFIDLFLPNMFLTMHSYETWVSS